jgi:NAD(P)-dependent dehydrogenase (short-subunit alcohol dehydrogenase family)
MTWTADAMGDQTGRTALVTGATSGLGLASAVALAAAGARVLITARDPGRGAAALARVRRDGGPAAELVHLDLADLDSVRRAAVDIRDRTGDALHLLLNNAGVMGTPPGVTIDGFETQIATNHLGPAALTWLLMPALRAAGAARVVTVSSLAHRGPGSTSTTSTSAAAPTWPRRPTASRSWPTCCSPRSWTAGCGPRATT